MILTESKIREIIRESLRKIISETISCLGIPYYQVRHLAHKVKAGDLESIDIAANLLFKYVPSNSILIPIPSHNGRATYTLQLARSIAKKSNSRVLDILSSPEREMLYNIKKKNKMNPNNVDLGFSSEYNQKVYNLLHSARNIILIDNVVDSGTTYKQSKDILEKVYCVNAWMLSLGVVPNPKSNPFDTIRSEINIYR